MVRRRFRLPARRSNRWHSRRRPAGCQPPATAATSYTYEANYSQYLELKAQREEIAQANERKRQNILRTELAWMRAGVQARGTKSKERIERFHKLNAIEKPNEQANIKLDAISSRLGKKIIECENLSKAYGEHFWLSLRDYTLHYVIRPCGKG